MAGHVHIESQAVVVGLWVSINLCILEAGDGGWMSRIDRDVPPYMLVGKSGASAIAQPCGADAPASLKLLRVRCLNSQSFSHSLPLDYPSIKR